MRSRKMILLKKREGGDIYRECANIKVILGDVCIGDRSLRSMGV